MIARRLSLFGVALSLLLPGCVVEKRDFEALRDQVRLHQKQINDLKARQEEQGLRVDTLNNGFKILGDKAEENASRIDIWARGTRSRRFRPWRLPPQPSRRAQRRRRTARFRAAPRTCRRADTPHESVKDRRSRSTAQRGDHHRRPQGREALRRRARPLFNRDYQQATAKFQEFVADYPDHKLAGNAQY